MFDPSKEHKTCWFAFTRPMDRNSIDASKIPMSLAQLPRIPRFDSSFLVSFPFMHDFSGLMSFLSSDIRGYQIVT
jgi:hypothetical protein